MKKILKWTFIVLGSFLVLIVAAAIILPIVFKDDIKAAIDKEIANSVNADVKFDIDKFGLSLFSNFPNITVQIEDLAVINREPFAGKTLFSTDKFEVEINIKDVLFGDELRIKGISLIHPVINVHVLKDGKANYDIAIPSTDTVQAETEEASDFSFGIDHWEIRDANIVYDDQSIPFSMELRGMDHEGSGDFTQDVFDLKTLTKADTVNVSFDGTEYLSNKHAEIDATISISEDITKYTFKENSAKINDFAMSFDGWFKMNENDFGMDISFKSPDNSFKSLLSLVPGIYSSSFGGIETKGDLAFNGFVKGTFSDTQMPAFNVNLNVKDAMFKYPDLPTAVNNINMELLLDNKDGVIDNTLIDLKKLHLEFGSNPVDARALITKMYPTNVDATLNTKLNLAELSKMFPMDGLEMKGEYAINLKAKGVYDSLKKTIPAIDATMSLANGYAKSADFPLPLENLKFNSTIKNATGKMAETVIAVNNFGMTMDGENFGAELVLQNLDNYTWDLKVHGGIDLEKMTKIFPLEGMTLAGKVKANIETKGKYSDVEAGKYDRLPTSGTASLKDFKYLTKDMPPVALSEAVMTFNPKEINLQKLNGTVGKSDYRVTGLVQNYIGYVFGNEVIKGVVTFNSNLFDLNEFMTDTEETTTTTDTSSFGVIPIPKNIDFVLKSDIKKVNMMDYKITNATGDIIVRNGVANLSNLKFDMLGGSFVINGTYNTIDIAHPRYNMALKIQNVSMQQAAHSSSLVRTYAPIAGAMNGNFSTDFKVTGELKQDMMPNLATVNGDGLINIAKAALKDSKIISGLTSITKLNDTNEVTLKDVLMSAKIENGKLSVQPFDVKVGEYKTTVAGSTALDGKVDYNLKMNVPAGKLGADFQGFINKNTGASNPTDAVPVTIGMGGTFANPQFKLLASEQKQQVKQAATNVAKEEGTKAVQKAVKGTEAEKVVNSILGGSTKKDTTKTGGTSTPAVNKDEVKKKQEELKKKAEEEAKKKAKSLLKFK